jgi:aspartate kinase
VLVEKDADLSALRAVHQAFELELEPAEIEPAEALTPVGETPFVTPRVNRRDLSGLVERLRGVDMEELMLDTISLDESQARVTIRGVPDRPGIAARIFQNVASRGIFVDMIVQGSKGFQGQTSLSFTVPTDQLSQTLKTAQEMVVEFGCQSVSHCPQVAKLSVSGIGLRSHTSVGIRMFRALAEAGINIDMINTSEVLMNVVIDGRHGPQGLAQLQAAFQDVLR